MISSRYPSFRSPWLGLMSKVLAGWMLLLGAASPGRAQGGFGPDPFRPYNSQYDPFVFGVAPGPLDLGRSRLGPGNGLLGANRFEDYMNSIQGGAGGARLGAGSPYSPYFQANRQYDEGFGRVYRPNKEADARFEVDQGEVTRLYFQYLREKDPKKRAELFRQYTGARTRVLRELASPRPTSSRTARRPATSARSSGAAATEDRDLMLAPPPLRRRGTRSRSAGAESTRDSAAGTAPPPLGRSTGGSGSARGVVPSEVLDRAMRAPRPRVRVPVPDPNYVPPPDPLKR
jgi:hypothetical protein